jgi:23S rRNA pseudouridine2605 synthase/16S rRNA pseudouridine516 synthase
MSTTDIPEAPSGPERIQKVLSRAGVASRRTIETWLVQGKIRVNGETVVELGARVTPGVDVVEVEGKTIALNPTLRYVILHKPTKVVTSLSDEKGRLDLVPFLEKIGERLFPVGRLDYDTSGLLLLTNDGEAANVLAHPSFGVTKRYLATVRGKVKPGSVKSLRDGVTLDDGSVVRADRVSIREGVGGGTTMVDLTLHSGQNRVVRRMCEAIGHPVITLHRTRFGPFHLGGLKPGEFRDLGEDERHTLATLVTTARKKVGKTSG